MLSSVYLVHLGPILDHPTKALSNLPNHQSATHLVVVHLKALDTKRHQGHKTPKALGARLGACSNETRHSRILKFKNIYITIDKYNDKNKIDTLNKNDLLKKVLLIETYTKQCFQYGGKQF